jgi:hypothetical protein
VVNIINVKWLRWARAIKARNAAIAIQSVLRARAAQKEIEGIREGVTRVQTQWRTIRIRGPHMKQVVEKRMRLKLETEMREKEVCEFKENV